MIPLKPRLLVASFFIWKTDKLSFIHDLKANELYILLNYLHYMCEL